MSARTRCLRPASSATPFIGGQDARHEIERDQSFRALVLAVYRKGDSEAMKQGIRLRTLLCEAFGGLSFEPVAVPGAMRARTAGVVVHFVIGSGHGLILARFSTGRRICAMAVRDRASLVQYAYR